MIRLFLAFTLVFLSTYGAASARKAGKEQARIYYFPHIHAAFGGRGYDGLGGDMVFFSYLHIALELIKHPKKYDIYKEGYFFDLYRGSWYRLSRKDRIKIRRHFRKGFPKHISHWTKRQKEIFVEMGPVTVLYVLRKVRRIRKTDIWRSEKITGRLLDKCSKTLYMRRLLSVYDSAVFTSWHQFYRSLRQAQKGVSIKGCEVIFTVREKYLVRRIKRRIRRTKKAQLIIYGYGHDFGKYFGDKISYLGSVELPLAAKCYHDRNKWMNPFERAYCAKNFVGWLKKLGHQSYFTNAIPKSLL